MKALTITCHNVYNHGALLQAWALATFLRSQGIDANIIDYQPDYLRGQYELKLRNSRYDHPLLKQLYLIAKYPGWRKSLKRKKNFDRFYNSYLMPLLHKGTYWSYDELKSNPPEADVYIAGSDQIWNTRFNNGKDPAFYLHFGTDKTRRLSYAASFATDRLADGTEKFVGNELKNLDAISVREASGLKILETLGFSGVQVVDPVFLLDAQTWKSKIGLPDVQLPDKPYILVYETHASEELPKLVRRMQTLTGMDVFTVSGYRWDGADDRYKDVGPDGFLHLIANASLVVSNSFHASAFSIIFERDFFIVERPDGLNQRMHDLLGAFHLSDRLINESASDATLKSRINYDKILNSVRSRIEESKQWLRQAL